MRAQLTEDCGRQLLSALPPDRKFTRGAAIIGSLAAVVAEFVTGKIVVAARSASSRDSDKLDS